LSIRDLIKPRNFICIAAVSCRIYQICNGICQILPPKSVGPNDEYTVSGKTRQRGSGLSKQFRGYRCRNKQFINFKTQIRAYTNC